MRGIQKDHIKIESEILRCEHCQNSGLCSNCRAGVMNLAEFVFLSQKLLFRSNGFRPSLEFHFDSSDFFQPFWREKV